MKRVVGTVRKWLSSMHFRHWLIVILPVTLCIYLFLFLGPGLQYYFFHVLNNQASSIYDAAVPNGVAQFLTLHVWLLGELQWITLLLAFVVVVLSFRKTSFRSISISVGVFAFIGQSASDTITMLLTSMPLSDFLPHLAGNLIGSFVLVIIAAVLLSLYTVMAREARRKGKIYIYAYPFLAVSLGISIVCCVYLIVLYFFQPTVVRIEATLGQPIAGTYSSLLRNSPREPADQSGGDDITFRMIPVETSGRRGLLDNVLGRLELSWDRLSIQSRFDLEIRLYVNCRGPANFAQMRGLATAAIAISDVRSLKAAFDNGLSNLEISGRPTTRFSVGAYNGGDYSITRDDESGLLRFTADVGPGDALTAQGEQETSFLIGAPLAPYRYGAAVGSARKLLLRINGADRELQFGGSPRVARGGPGCRPTNLTRVSGSPGAMERQGSVALPENARYVSALVTVRPAPGVVYAGQFGSQARITGASGRLAVVGISPPSEGRRLGGTDLLTFQGNIKELRVDGNRIETGPNTEVVAQGELSAEMNSSGEMHVLGTATALRQAGVRVNPTKWERQSPEFQIAGLGFLIALILALLRALRPVLAQFKKDDRLVWYP